MANHFLSFQNPNFADTLPSTSRQRVPSPISNNNCSNSNNNNNSSDSNVIENNNSNNKNNNSSYTNNSLSNNTDNKTNTSTSSYGNSNNSNSSFSNSSNSSFSNSSNSTDRMDILDLTPIPEMRTLESSIYGWLPQSKSKKKKQYVYWKMLKDEEIMQSCLKKFKQCNIEEDTKFTHVSTSKDSSGSRLKRKIAQKKRDSYVFGATSTGRVFQHHQTTSSATVSHKEGLQNRLPLPTPTLSNAADEPFYFVDDLDNNTSE